MKTRTTSPMRKLPLASAMLLVTLTLSGCHGLHVAASVHDSYGHGHGHYAPGHGHRGGHGGHRGRGAWHGGRGGRRNHRRHGGGR